MKAEIFDIKNKKIDQVNDEAKLSSHESLLLCLDLMDLSIALNKGEYLVQHPDFDANIEWIELVSSNEG